MPIFIKTEKFKNKTLKWLDPGTGQGYITFCIYNKLLDGLKYEIPNLSKRRDHIIKNMLYMIEINPEHIDHLKHHFGNDANIYNTDYVTTDIFNNIQFDIIVGNPPYNSLGGNKVPTNKKINKKDDGKIILRDFIKKSLLLLKKETGL